MEIEREKIRKADPKQWYGSEWVEHLLEYPEDAEKCNKWNEIDAEHWIMLLKSRKEFISKCSLDQLVDVLLVDISFKKLCEFPRFNAKQVSRLVTKYPQWVNEFSKDTLSNIDLEARIKLLCHYPDLVDAINKWNDFSDFSEEQVVEILLKNYSFVTRFRKDVLNNISTKNRVRLLIKHPDLVKEEIIANWIPDFSEEQVVEILWENSSFVNQFEIRILRCISIEDRVRLLIKHPDLVKVEVFLIGLFSFHISNLICYVPIKNFHSIVFGSHLTKINGVCY